MHYTHTVKSHGWSHEALGLIKHCGTKTVSANTGCSSEYIQQNCLHFEMLQKCFNQQESWNSEAHLLLTRHIRVALSVKDDREQDGHKEFVPTETLRWWFSSIWCIEERPNSTDLTELTGLVHKNMAITRFSPSENKTGVRTKYWETTSCFNIQRLSEVLKQGHSTTSWDLWPMKMDVEDLYWQQEV